MTSSPALAGAIRAQGGTCTRTATWALRFSAGDVYCCEQLSEGVMHGAYERSPPRRAARPGERNKSGWQESNLLLPRSKRGRLPMTYIREMIPSATNEGWRGVPIRESHPPRPRGRVHGPVPG